MSFVFIVVTERQKLHTLHLTAYLSCFPEVLQTLDHFIHLPHSAQFHKCRKGRTKYYPVPGVESTWGILFYGPFKNTTAIWYYFFIPSHCLRSHFFNSKYKLGQERIWILLLIRGMSLEQFWFTSYLWQKFDVWQRSELFISNLQNHYTTISRRDSHSVQQDSVSRLCFCAGSLNPERLEC